jgi:hypothetical protein
MALLCRSSFSTESKEASLYYFLSSRRYVIGGALSIFSGIMILGGK